MNLRMYSLITAPSPRTNPLIFPLNKAPRSVCATAAY
jgi:hypothetical protein